MAISVPPPIWKPKSRSTGSAQRSVRSMISVSQATTLVRTADILARMQAITEE